MAVRNFLPRRWSSTGRQSTATIGVALLGLMISTAACSNGSQSDSRSGPPAATPSGDPAPPATGTSRSANSPEEPAAAGPARIRISFGNDQVEATLRDTPAARDLVAQLPLELDMSEHGGVEKTGPLPNSLSTDGEPEGADPDVGAIGYYAPGNDLVLYHGDQSYYSGIVVLGEMGEGFEALRSIDGDVRVTVELLG